MEKKYCIIYSDMFKCFFVSDGEPSLKNTSMYAVYQNSKAWKILFLKGIVPSRGYKKEIDKEFYHLIKSNSYV
jgi:hypothetical protein